MKMIGYLRTENEKAIETLKSLGCANVIVEKVGTMEYKRILLEAERGDIIIVQSLHDVVNSIDDLIYTLSDLYNRGVKIKSVKEPWINTASTKEVTSGTYIGQLMKELYKFDQSLRNTKRKAETTRSKIAGGRRLREHYDLETAVALVKEGKKTMQEIADHCGMSRATLWKRLNELKAKGLL